MFLDIREVLFSCKCVLIIYVYYDDRRARLHGPNCDICRPGVLFIPKNVDMCYHTSPHKIIINHIIFYIREVWLSCKCIVIIYVYYGDSRALLQVSNCDIYRLGVLFIPKMWIRTSTSSPTKFL